MKKFVATLICFLTCLSCCFVGTACNDSNKASPDKDVSTSNSSNKGSALDIVTLSKENYQKYIATYTRVIVDNSTHTYTYYYYDFVGSTLCKFNDAKIEYCFSSSEDIPENPTYYTCDLTISGCGQSKRAMSGYYISGGTNLIVVEVSGTVEMLY